MLVIKWTDISGATENHEYIFEIIPEKGSLNNTLQQLKPYSMWIINDQQ